ncbi:hypothetical protein P152DRAFT_457928 [Eremomyces bilateralis CBS 781.70]|uniref:RING-CH-type domain-containing protein n=1 Tax=Eremomyces bilateralis CBS 781.70 TaxID=1392243 RepID=A0A6G1G3U8_9PEZI|nr:uncharacterized protein P152DRAFT_457928 [Eremomyces bilateralis CBS 781.70]KAF1812733.1 hypothetical protein P152DRAFT_457928 [Eremomyces bilateralis CBS 781.70]
MASLPPRQRRSSPSSQQTPNIESPDAGPIHTSQSTASIQSADSQTLLPGSQPNLEDNPTSKPTEMSTSQPPPASTSDEPADDSEARRCWICFSDETEDPQPTTWRTPCPCALAAHESCLLDWIADMESPSSNRQAGQSPELKCPQCKSPIIVTRPTSVIVQAVRAMEYAVSFMMLPGLAVVVAYPIYQGMLGHGEWTIRTVFGREDAERILAPIHMAVEQRVALFHNAEGWGDELAIAMGHWATNWHLNIGLPLIPVFLTLNRTSALDNYLPLVPMLFFASGATSLSNPKVTDLWPPSASASFAILPYIRAAYNGLYHHFFASYEKQWLKEIQPRHGTNENGQNNDDNDDAAPGVGIEMEMILEDSDGDTDDEMPPLVEPAPPNQNQPHTIIVPPDTQPPHTPPVDQPTPPHGPPQNGPDPNGGAPAPNIPVPPQAPPGAQPAPNRREDRGGQLLLRTTWADTLFGALLFPAIASGVGELLKHALPASWVMAPTLSARFGKLAGPTVVSWMDKLTGAAKPTGVLQMRWGRTLVGGCVFVVLKDALMLYVRWRMARDHRMRRIVDFEGSKGRRKEGKKAAR